ncbi:hypothetical protein [Curtanaerobium respiraculi]|jgi:polyhydroxyalkanoate synthesis regulator phasin|uniref:hypothetical protein n=1 Tax=Curtanaerobium respiraculi TaxID=2949669 RepID=UPI0024B381CF|nr:hypothetical protein [Curtanaerobium respiraculi]
MANIGEGFKSIFLAGIGAAALTSEKAKEVVDKMISRGELTVEQGKQINEELQHKANDATQAVRETALEARMTAMNAEERAAFAAKAAEIAAKLNASAEVVEAEVVEEGAGESAADEEEPEA